MDASKDRELLLSLLPHVLLLAEFYTGNDQEAVAAREEVDRNERNRDPFFANFYVELQTLEDNADTHDTSLDLPAESVSQVLKLLESQCFVLTVWGKLWNVGTGLKPNWYELMCSRLGSCTEICIDCYNKLQRFMIRTLH